MVDEPLAIPREAVTQDTVVHNPIEEPDDVVLDAGQHTYTFQ